MYNYKNLLQGEWWVSELFAWRHTIISWTGGYCDIQVLRQWIYLFTASGSVCVASSSG